MKPGRAVKKQPQADSSERLGSSITGSTGRKEPMEGRSKRSVEARERRKGPMNSDMVM